MDMEDSENEDRQDSIHHSYPLKWWTDRIGYGSHVLDVVNTIDIKCTSYGNYDMVDISYDYCKHDKKIKMQFNIKARPDCFYPDVDIMADGELNSRLNLIRIYENFDINHLNDGQYWQNYIGEEHIAYLPGQIICNFWFQLFVRIAHGNDDIDIKKICNKKIRRIFFHLAKWNTWNYF